MRFVRPGQLNQMVQARKKAPPVRAMLAPGRRPPGGAGAGRLGAGGRARARGGLAGAGGRPAHQYLEALFQRSSPAVMREFMGKVAASPRTPAHMKQMLVEQLAKTPLTAGLGKRGSSPGLLSLPPEILMQVVQNLDHKDLQGLFQCCHALADTAKEARDTHFNFRTPVSTPGAGPLEGGQERGARAGSQGPLPEGGTRVFAVPPAPKADRYPEGPPASPPDSVASGASQMVRRGPAAAVRGGKTRALTFSQAFSPALP